MKKILLAASLLALASSARAEEPDNIKLPPGFHATVVADKLGVLRHLAFRDNDNLYVSTQWNNTGTSGDLIALHLDKNRVADKTVHFGVMGGGTGIRVYKGALYAASLARVYRYSFHGKDLVPISEPVIVLDGMPATRLTARGLAFDGKGNMYVSAGSVPQVDWCADPNIKTMPPKGLDHCPILDVRSGIWRFPANKLNQDFKNGERYGTGIRDMAALTWSPSDDALYGIMHGRDNTNKAFPNAVSPAEDDAISDEMHKVVKGTDFGWPYTYWDGARAKRIIGVEYTGNNNTEAPAGKYSTPVEAFHARSAPLDLVFHDGKSVPAKYRNGAFITRHGANSIGPNRPNGNNGFDVVFIPFDRHGKSGPMEEFATGFPGPNAADRTGARAKFRPVGVTEAPDGSLYVTDSKSGRIWRIAYTGN